MNRPAWIYSHLLIQFIPTHIVLCKQQKGLAKFLFAIAIYYYTIIKQHHGEHDEMTRGRWDWSEQSNKELQISILCLCIISNIHQRTLEIMRSPTNSSTKKEFNVSLTDYVFHNSLSDTSYYLKLAQN